MTSSRWNAQGNIYLVTEESPLSADVVRADVGDADGILEVRAAGDDWVEIVIWNPDGSQAELSGNGTRIAARWLSERTGAESVTVRVGAREVRARMLDDTLVEQDVGAVEVGDPEEIEGIRFRRVVVGNPHAVVEGDPAGLPRIGPLLETHPRFPGRTNVQVARWDGDDIEARVWERGVGETASSGTSAVAAAAALGATGVTVRFPGGPLSVRFEDGRALLTGPAVRVDDEYVLDTPTVRSFVAEVRDAVARTTSPESACEAIRPLFAELLADDEWLPQEYRQPVPDSGMGGGIGQWALFRAADGSLSLFALVVPPGASTPVHDHLAWGLVGLYRGTQDEEIYALRGGRLELSATRALEPGDFYALIPPQDDIHRVRTTSPDTSVSIHLLTNDTGCVWRHAYEPESGRVEPFRSGYANVVCASDREEAE
jgi:3-mercaptopropionate dioxygenase